jgi:hypothetical protein
MDIQSSLFRCFWRQIAVTALLSKLTHESPRTKFQRFISLLLYCMECLRIPPLELLAPSSANATIHIRNGWQTRSPSPNDCIISMPPRTRTSIKLFLGTTQTDACAEFDPTHPQRFRSSLLTTMPELGTVKVALQISKRLANCFNLPLVYRFVATVRL